MAGVAGLVVSVVTAAGLLGDVARLLGLAVIVLALVGLLVTGRLARGIAGSLDELVEATSRLEDGDYAARVPEHRRGPRPVRALVRGFNTLAARLETDEAQRRTLLADVSHELRTPLAVVQGNVEAILDGVHPADEEHLRAILEETHVLSRLVEDLRTVALSEGGTLPLHREPTDLAVLAGEVVTSFRPAAEAAGVALSATIGPDVPLLEIDPVRIREVIANLVANALRHTPAGGSVTITGQTANVAMDRGEAVELTVRDTGSGIDPALLPHVFDRFAKSSDSRGSGLGLAIARGLVEAHGGTIAVDSPPGEGTVFRCRLPIRPAGDAAG